MAPTPNDYRREAVLFEEAARWISLQSEKEELLAAARSLRLRADVMETQLQCSSGPMETGSTPVDTD